MLTWLASTPMTLASLVSNAQHRQLKRILAVSVFESEKEKHMERRKAFTLIELLVVIAIIALMLSILRDDQAAQSNS